MKDLKQTKDIVALFAEIINCVEKALDDGVITAFDARHFIKVLPLFYEAVKDGDKIPEEFKDISREDSEELCRFLAQKIDIKNDELEEIIENMLQAIFYTILSLSEVIKRKKEKFL